MAIAESASGLDLVVCACGAQEYTARYAIDAAMFRGELDDKWEKFLCDVGAEDRADELDLDADEAAISAAAEAFRYEHDLITAEEVEAWLATRALTFDDFSDYFTRQYYAGAVDENVIPDEVEYHSASPELRQSFFADLMLSGEFERMTTDLMWRLAAGCAEENPSSEAIAAETQTFLERHRIKPAHLANWLKNLRRDSEWLDEMMTMEAAYRKRCETVLVPQARRREVISLRLLLTRIEMEAIELESRDAAQEALLCVREDGMSMEEVAAEGGYPYRRATLVLEDVPADAQQTFMSASAGHISEPIPRGDGFELFRVINKIEPQADDPALQSRIDQRLLERYFSDLAGKYVQPRLGGRTTATE